MMEGFVQVRKDQWLNLAQVRVIEVAEGGVRITWASGDKEFLEKSEAVMKWLKSKVAP